MTEIASPKSGAFGLRALSVSKLISIGFATVLLLHIITATLSHYGLKRAEENLVAYNALISDAIAIADIDLFTRELERNILLFVQTGGAAPADRVTETHARLNYLLVSITADDLKGSDRERFQQMRAHLDNHEELFEAVKADRSRRRQLFDETIAPLFEKLCAYYSMLEPDVSRNGMSLKRTPHLVESAHLEILNFMRTPDSIRVRRFKELIDECRGEWHLLANDTASNAHAISDQVVHDLGAYETAALDMVQATRGYLHLVNVVMAGEAAEFLRVAREMRQQELDEIDSLALHVANDQRQFQSTSLLISLLTIFLGVFAGIVIRRRIAPPLGAITRTFQTLAKGNIEADIPFLNRSDEIGALACAAEVFRQRSEQIEELLDETQHRQAELDKAQRQLTAALSGGNVGLWEWNVDTGKGAVSPELLAQIGEAAPAEWASVEDWKRRLHPDDLACAVADLSCSMRDEAREYNSTFRLRHADGEYRWIHSRGKRAMNERGSAALLVGVHIDITERKAAEVELALRNAELSRRNAELDEFTYVASHDLQEPLRKLISFGKLLPGDLGGDLPEKAAADLHYITDAAQRMRVLVDDLLRLSRAGRTAVHLREVGLDECLDQAISSLDLRINETGAQIHRTPLPTVKGDATLLTQLFQNLLGNAIKFVDRGTKPEVLISAERNAKGWIIGVKDNGVGLDPAYREQIFAPFKRLHSKADYEGSGIGLAICRKAVELHNGEIWVESAPGAGAHFRFQLAGTNAGDGR